VKGAKMKISKYLLLMVLVTFFISMLTVTGQEMSQEEQEMMKKWQAYATPGQGHKFLQKFVGQWEVTTKMWQKPGAKPEITQGSAAGKMILGGRYVKLAYKGTVMGMPFEGFGLHAYDNHIKKYLSTWIDNVGTGIMFSTGSVDKSGKILTEHATIDDFMTGKKEKVKSVTTFVNADKFVMEMYMVSPQGDFKNLEITHVKKK
jgi:hypothetical protein